MNFSYLQIDGNYREKDYSLEGYKAYETIQNEIYTVHGVNEEFKELIQLKYQWIEKKAQAIKEDNRFKNMEAKIIKVDQDFIILGLPDIDEQETFVKLQTVLGFRLDEKK